MATDASEGRGAPRLVDAFRAGNPYEARIVAGVLADAGITSWIQGALLADEFAMSQALMNLQQVTIQVHEADLEPARAAIARARRAADAEAPHDRTPDAPDS